MVARVLISLKAERQKYRSETRWKRWSHRKLEESIANTDQATSAHSTMPAHNVWSERAQRGKKTTSQEEHIPRLPQPWLDNAIQVTAYRNILCKQIMAFFTQGQGCCVDLSKTWEFVTWILLDLSLWNSRTCSLSYDAIYKMILDNICKNINPG